MSQLWTKNNPELFTEITKNLEEIKNNDRIKNMVDITKIIKTNDNQKT